MLWGKKLLIQQLQERLVPFLVAQGFQQLPLSERDRKSREMVLMLPLGYLKRTHEENLELVEVQLHPRRPTFVLAFGVAPPQGVTLPWAYFPQSDVRVADLPEHCRLYASRRSMKWFGPSWLSFGRDTAIQIAKTIERAIELLPEVEDYFRRGTVGSHVKCICYSLDPSGKLKVSARST